MKFPALTIFCRGQDDSEQQRNMSEKTERRIVTAAAVLLVAVMVAFGVHQYFELKQLDRENYATIR